MSGDPIASITAGETKFSLAISSIPSFCRAISSSISSTEEESVAVAELEEFLDDHREEGVHGQISFFARRR